MSARFRPPRMRRSAIRRQALVNRLHDAIGQGRILVQAPAGFGKTTLLAEFASEVDYDVRWLTLDGSSSVPEVFAAQVARALLGDAAIPPSSAVRPDDLQTYLGAQLEAVADLPEPVLLIIDECQELVTDEQTVGLLGQILDALPEGLEVVLSGRKMPALPELDGAIASGEITLLNASSLAFTVEEIRALCDQKGSLYDPEAVLEATQGWPIGVMAMLSGSVTPASAAERQQSVAWERFLLTQVWEGVPGALQSVLLTAAVRPVVEREALSGLVGEAAARRLMTWLSEHDFLCEPLGDGDVRLNPLLRSFALERFARTEPAAFAERVARAVDEADSEGRVSDALELARTTGQSEALAGVLERRGSQLIRQGAFALLWHGLEALPEEIVRQRDLLMALQVRARAHMSQLEEALEEARTVLDRSQLAPAARVHALLGQIQALLRMGKLEEAAAALAIAEEVPHEDKRLRAELTFHEAQISLRKAEFVRAEEQLQRAVEQSRAGGDQVLELLAQSTLGQLLGMRGNGPEAVTMLLRAAEGWRSVGRSANLAWVLNNLGMAYLQVGDFQSARSVLEEAHDESDRCESRRWVAYTTASLGDAEIGLGNWGRARGRYEEAIAICADDAPDETLAALAIAGLSAALLGVGELQQADFFARRAVLVATASGSGFELGICKLQQAAVDSAAGRHNDAITGSRQAQELFRAAESKASLAQAHYRVAMCEFRAGNRQEAQRTLRELEMLLTETWMVAALMPLVRENPMFAQWAASRNLAGRAFREYIERNAFAIVEREVEEEAPAASKFPVVVARSLGPVSVSVGGREVDEEGWASARAKELFFLFLARRENGLRKEEAVELLYPDLPREKCNSAFHSNLYRLRKALYQDSVVKRDGGYVLNPEGAFNWDVERFDRLMERAEAMPSGSTDRAGAYRQALELYQGPFAEAFYSEWAASLRERLSERSQQALAVLGGYYAGRDDFDAAAGCVEQILQANRFNEEAAYQLAVYRSRAGHQAAALSFLDDYRRAYEEEYGEALPLRFQTLRSQIAAGEVAV